MRVIKMKLNRAVIMRNAIKRLWSTKTYIYGSILLLAGVSVFKGKYELYSIYLIMFFAVEYLDNKISKRSGDDKTHPIN